MTSRPPNDIVLNDYPPGHPAGTDEFISAGEVTSGRGMGLGGVLGTQARVAAEPTTAIATPSSSGSDSLTVLIALDGTSISEGVVRTAHRLFGDNATYLAINVGDGPYTQMSWAYVWPAAAPSAIVPPAWVDDGSNEPRAVAAASAEAAAVTRAAELDQSTPIGDVGDPTSAILRAAHHYRADVVVIGADSRGWLSHLIDHSVERELLHEADFAVLVVARDGSDAKPSTKPN